MSSPGGRLVSSVFARPVLLGGALAAVVAAASGCADGDRALSAPPSADEVGAVRGGRAPRLIAPLSTTHVPTKQPTLEWRLPHGARRARVELCADRGCATMLQSFEVAGERAQVPAPLPDGAVFWRVTALAGGSRDRETSATWQMWPTGMNFPQPGLEGPPADTSWGSVLDVDGDGLADVAVGAPDSGSGLVLVYFGRASAFGADVQTLTGGDGFGKQLASAGDVNGDGYADLAVATSADANAVQVFYGGPSGLGAQPTTLTTGRIVHTGGPSLATAGDANGDGYADLLVGGADVAGVYLGAPRGIAATRAFALEGDDVDPTESAFAGDVSGGADVNGDRLSDVAVRGWIYLGNGNGFTLQPGQQRHFLQSGTFVGDVNGDGLSDWAEEVLLPGTPSGLGTFPFWDIPDRHFVATAGDTNRDGFADLVAHRFNGQPGHRWLANYGNPLSCQGLDCGPPENEITFPDWDLTQPDPAIGWAPLGDVNGDHFEDLGAAIERDGVVHVFLGPDIPTTSSLDLRAGVPHFGAWLE